MYFISEESEKVQSDKKETIEPSEVASESIDTNGNQQEVKDEDDTAKGSTEDLDLKEATKTTVDEESIDTANGDTNTDSVQKPACDISPESTVVTDKVTDIDEKRVTKDVIAEVTSEIISADPKADTEHDPNGNVSAEKVSVETTDHQISIAEKPASKVVVECITVDVKSDAVETFLVKTALDLISGRRKVSGKI